MYEMVIVSPSSLDGARGSAILGLCTAVVRPHVEAEQRPQAFQVQASDKVGEKVGWIVLAFNLGGRDLSA